ncbi:MAG: EAL domain-containing protein [Acidobacteriaceae bacterium]|nr:EAL domain-containing protein [Acidobacteriaceae bacterium]
MCKKRINAEETDMGLVDAADLSALMESSQDFIWSVDLDYRLLTFNRALQMDVKRRFGMELAAGQRAEEVSPAALAAQWAPLYDVALREGQVRTEVTSPDGCILDVVINRMMVDGKARGLSAFAKDITRWKSAECALREAEKKYQEIFDGALEGMYRATLDGRLLEVNSALTKMLGYTKAPARVVAEMKDLAYEVWANPQDRERLLQLLEENGSVQGFECQFKRQDGKLIWVTLSSRLVKDSGNEPCIDGFVEDITERKVAQEHLQESVQQLRLFVKHAPGALAMFDREMRYIWASNRWRDAFCLGDGDLTGHSHYDDPIVFPERWREAHRRGIAGEVLCEEADRVHALDGSSCWNRWEISPWHDAQGEVGGIIIFTEDITARKKAEQGLLESEDRYRTAFQTSLDAININRVSDGLYIDVNDAFLDIMGYSREEVIGKTSLELKVWKDPLDREKVVEELRRNGFCRDKEVAFQQKNGQILWGQISASFIELDGEKCLLSVTRDVSEAKHAEAEIRHLAFYDTLTGLPNRRLLLDRLHQAQAASGRSRRQRALLFVDLDDFKTLNDTLGHPVGDLQLQEVGRRLSRCVRETDTVSRFGGDEFVVMLEDLSELPEQAASQAKGVAEKILAALGDPYLLNGREHRSSASIGITLFQDQRESTDEVLKQADIAMYQAKSAGRNTMRFFAPALQTAVNARAALEGELRDAIQKEQFELYYQPQMNRAEVNGAEALLRWRHPSRGLLLPAEFIASSEETGLILPLGEWVLETACRQIAAWGARTEMAGITVAVNISARQLHQANFVESVLAALARTGANPENLRLELTESIVVDNVEDVIAKMTELRIHGVRFSLDDFGTGYSSLAYLKRLPLDQLKIDRSFVRDILVDEGSGAIAETIISLSRVLGLKVIAEGVETEEQRRFLTRLKCHSFQGYLYSRPVPIGEFEAMVLSMEHRGDEPALFD